MNYLIIAGYLGADPEVRFTSSGQKVITLRVATRSRKKKVEETIWWRCTIWGDQFENLMPYLKKGSAVVVVGDMHKPEIFTDREGKSQISLEMTVSNISFSPFGRSANASENKEENKKGESQDFSMMSSMSGITQGKGNSAVIEPVDEEIPF